MPLSPAALSAYLAGRQAPAGEIHTNFRINRAGEPLILTAPDGITCLDYISPVEIPRDTSYGRNPENPAAFS